MRYLIIEDERLAMTELKRMVTRLRPAYECAGWSESAEDSVAMLAGSESAIDLVFADIRLTDGISFDIFDQTGYNGPVIFTTAYDEYTLQAFKVNGIDYLLKPIGMEELEAAILKFERLCNRKYEEDETPRKPFKNRFLITVGDDMLPIAAKEIAFFNSEDGYTFANTFAGKRYIVDISIESLADMLESSTFCRVSRAYICNINAITKVAKMFGGRLKVITKPDSPGPIIVSRERASKVIRWMNGEETR